MVPALGRHVLLLSLINFRASLAILFGLQIVKIIVLRCLSASKAGDVKSPAK